jgi:hypothetical protein
MESSLKLRSSPGQQKAHLADDRFAEDRGKLTAGAKEIVLDGCSLSTIERVAPNAGPRRYTGPSFNSHH